MTAPWREYVPCVVCGAQVSTEVPVKTWIRAHNALDSRQACLCIGDSDLWVQRYGERTRPGFVSRDVMYLMLLEVKTHGRDLEESQRELLHLANQLLRTMPWKEHRAGGRFVTGHAQNFREVYATLARRRVLILCYGVHKLRLSGSTPADSREITWDDKPIDAAQLVSLLRFDLSPDTLRPEEHRRHKRGRAEQKALLPLSAYLGDGTT